MLRFKRCCRAGRVEQHLQLLTLAVVVCSLQLAVAQTASPAARAHSWSFFNIHSCSFIGNWNNQTFQAQIWLRNMCHNSTVNIVRMMAFIHGAPYITTSPEGVHSITPEGFLSSNGAVPEVWFQSALEGVSVTAEVLTNYDQLIKLQEDAAALTMTAELPANVPFTLRMEGSERVHQLPVKCSPKQHPLFTDHSVWLGIVDGTTVKSATAEHSRLAFHIPSPSNVANRRSRSDTADDHSISGEVLTELASVLGIGGGGLGGGAVSSTAVSSSALTGDAGNGSTSSSSDDGLDSDVGTIVAELQKLQQRKLLSRSGSMFDTVLTSVSTKVLPTGSGNHLLNNTSSGNGISHSVSHNTQKPLTGFESSNNGGAASGAVLETQAIIDAVVAAAAKQSNTGAAATQPPGTTDTKPAQNSSGSSSSEPSFGFGLEAAGASSSSGGSSVPSRRGRSSAAMVNSSSTAAAARDFEHRGAVMRFLTLQHLAHHKALGFAGTVMVVTPHTAEQLLQSRSLRRAVQRQRLVLIIWDQGLEPRASHFMQVPAYNLLRLAAWGSDVALGFWDLDEYLVLPNHESVSHEVFDGCLSSTLALQPEAVIPSMWVSSTSWNASGELAGWMHHGHWLRAVQRMSYAMWPYTFCDGACKSIIRPDSDLSFQVHQHARPPPREPVWPVNWRCGYILHFYQLWGQRVPELMQVMGYESDAGVAGTPLMMEDIMPKSGIDRLARLAKLYGDMVSNNPALAPPN